LTQFDRSLSNEEDQMSRGFPSMTALLGMLAIAGYQNRDKLAEMLGGALPKGESGGAPGQQGGLGGLLEQFKGASVGGLLGGGLGELVDRFKQAGRGDIADSWVGTGPNKSVAPIDLEQALGPDVMQISLGREDFRATNFWRGYRAIFRRQSTSTRPTVACPPSATREARRGYG